jgi:hypothetical protein
MPVTVVKKPVAPADGWASAPWPKPAPEGSAPPATPKPAKVKKVKKATAKRAKEQSSIAFPYMDLDTAIAVARAFVENGGGPRTRDQLAGALGQSPLSGAFIMKLSAARQFGLVDFAEGKFKLTDLGFSIVDKNEAREKSAKVQAFLNVELYRKIYEDFKGKQLPPRPHGLEQTFVQMGVTQKQKTSARLAFDKSARQAGFSTLDPDRLIEPMLGGGPGGSTAAVVGPIKRPISFAGGGAGGSSLDPLIIGLLDRLPPPGESWSIDKRKKWLLTFEANLEMIYPAEDRKPDDLSVQKQDEN